MSPGGELRKATSDLRNDDKSAAAFCPLPGLFDIGEGNFFGFDAYCARGSPCQDLLHGSNEHFARRHSGGSQNCQCGASQDRGG